MKTYLGTEIVKAQLMTKLEFINLTGEGYEKGSSIKEGYLVIHPDGSKSWCQKEVFEKSYREITRSEKELMQDLDVVQNLIEKAVDKALKENLKSKISLKSGTKEQPLYAHSKDSIKSPREHAHAL